MFSAPGTIAAAPADAATVILLRESAPKCLESFLLRRSSRSSFMSNHYVFPGGRVDPADGAPEALARVAGRTGEAAAVECGAPAERALAIQLAAVRELFEEAGVLLARDAAGRVVDFDGARGERFHAHRRALWDNQTTMAAILTAEDVTVALDLMGYWARWITPSLEPKRFDARFFVAELPPGQTPLHDQRETVAELWMAPGAAAAAAASGEVKLPPPTLRNMEDLAALATLDAVRAESRLRARTPHAILPRVHDDAGRIALLLPWDPEYGAGSGDALEWPAGHPQAVGPSRFVLEGQAWVSRHGDRV
jgi:8-oxo-dGTP pyrophosphatase MutT (NUDIX family)